jgi:hypothetical protein
MIFSIFKAIFQTPLPHPSFVVQIGFPWLPRRFGWRGGTVPDDPLLPTELRLRDAS